MKKVLFAFLGSAVVLVACNNNASETSASTEKKDSSSTTMNDKEAKEIRNRKIAMESLEAFNNHNPDAVMKDADPNTVDYNDGSMAPVKSADSVKAAIRAWLTAMPDTKGEDLKAVAEGDWVMVWGKWSGTWKADFMGMKPTGKSYKINDVDIFKFSDDGKILEHHSVQSSTTIATQLGMKIQK